MSAWVTTVWADGYYSTRLGAEDFWASGTPKLAALTTAQADLEGCGAFDFADYTASGAATDAMMAAVCEQALFLLRDPDGVEGRAALIAQGVRSASIVGEAFVDGARETGGVVIAPRACRLLAPYLSTSRGSGSFSVTK